MEPVVNEAEVEEVYSLLAEATLLAPKEEKVDLLSRQICVRVFGSLKPETLNILKHALQLGIKYPTKKEFYGWAKAHRNDFYKLFNSVNSAIIYGDRKEFIALSDINWAMWEVKNKFIEEEL